ncbi:DUF5127 domain-containing protein [uncultured Muribaculum sp.]|uniref:glutaminase domain-containing protein n=1 Tax=uncultured Muribaculum sp. TaxID=1918613 RepID=UPI0025E15DE5|nr:DUF5127 domain-containing protein [uncultured Muribaculum sp.]
MKPIGKSFITLAVAGALSLQASGQTAEDFVPYRQSDLRLPSVPIIINDPYFSIWSNYDNLNDGATTHWSLQEKAIDGLLRVDGTTYRFLGHQKQNILSPIAPMTIDGDGWSGKVNYDVQNGTDWTRNDFNDSSWAVEEAAWGTPGEYPSVKNPWTGDNKDIYIRRTVNLSSGDLEKDLWLKYSHDDVFELYINGTKVINTGLTWLQGEQHKLSAQQKALLKAGENMIAAHCHNTNGGSYVDFGLYENLLKETDAIKQAKQTGVDVMATSSYYTFECGPVNLDVVFTAPLLIDDLDLISTPINYISYQVKSNDGQKHDVQFFIGTTPQLTVNEMNQPTESSIITSNGVRYIKSGSQEQKVLGRSGDLISIDWGYLYIPAVNGNISIASQPETEECFITTGKLVDTAAGTSFKSTNSSNMPSLSFCNDLGKVKDARSYMMIGYDEVYDMQYMKKNYKAYYARNGKTIFDAFGELDKGYSDIMSRCRALDKTIYDDGLAAGNVKYAELLSGVYRLVMGAHKLFQDDKGQALYFSKENKSNGCVNTVDLTYPESPLYLMYNLELQKGMVLSILDYAMSDARKDKNCAAHDLGQYPLANGQVYGDTMPLEESANIILLANAICRITGDGTWLKPYRNVLNKWANYCYQEGQNPGNQLCTDDFKGPSEQNTNLSVKAILAVAAYAELIPYIQGNPRDVERFQNYARNMALLWEADARDGDHYRMEFHKRGTWSQKYNLIWDKMWGYNIFPAEVLDREIKFYLTKQQRYGLPLDCRDLQTKADWIMWTAAMAPDTETFLKFADPVYDYADQTTSRIPLSDYYWSNTGRDVNFSARSVLGGLWMKVLMDKIAPNKVETGWAPKGNHIKTRWAAQVDPENVLPEYPRPIMKRDDWQNLNGLWDYAIVGQNETPKDFEGQILVPFAIESSLSGVMRPLEPGKALWYKREITIPAEWEGKNIMLNFGAVDYQANVYVNGTTGRYLVGKHTGGHSAFSVDLTSRIKNGKATVYVQVIDNTDERMQPVGKQRRYPNGGGDIFYTSTSGIWQTVWMEPVEKAHITSIRTTPDIDNGKLNFEFAISSTPSGKLTVTLKDGDNVVTSKSTDATPRTTLSLDVNNAKLWSPKSPFLYGVEITLTDGDKVTDKVDSYAAMRKISSRKDENGFWRLQLNNRDLFQFGPLDQGYWPDGLMTAPTDEALRYDIEKTKDWGFNMIRKHMKTEPYRWYFHCDSIGLLVWQDMPSTFRNHEDWIAHTWYADHECNQDPTLEKNFRDEWKEIIDQFYSHPCIVVWTPFNEAWGQFKTADIVSYTQSLDWSRLVNPASGGNHYRLGEGTFVDQHTYGQPIVLEEGVFDASRPYVLGEYGGLGRNMPGHRWFERNSQTYNTYPSEKAITEAYVKLAGQIEQIAKGFEKNGNKMAYGAAVYTQTTDVETEVNGIMTYDREVIKFDEPAIREAAGKLTNVFDEFSSVNVPFVDGVIGEPVYYNLQGMRIKEPLHGINIVKDADGTTHKVMIP